MSSDFRLRKLFPAAARSTIASSPLANAHRKFRVQYWNESDGAPEHGRETGGIAGQITRENPKTDFARAHAAERAVPATAPATRAFSRSD